MNLPSLRQPFTNNLYKLQAVAGSLLIVLSILIPAYWSYTDFLKGEDTRAKLNLLETERNILEQDFDRIPIDDPVSRDKREKLWEKSKQLQLKLSALKNENERGQTGIILHIIFRILSLVPLFCGLILAVKGFFRWQTTAQKNKDLLIKNQAKESALKSDSNEPLIDNKTDKLHE